jgi:hypothetical protein
MCYQIYKTFRPPKNIVFCLINTASQYQNSWAKELVKNSADFEISTITGVGYDVVVGNSADEMLPKLSSLYSHAVVCAMGTIWADNKDFFTLLDEKCTTEFFVMGHILDKKTGYYELHPQCFVINLKTYTDLGHPELGSPQLDSPHIQLAPIRSEENFHDDYTPMSVKTGNINKQYHHKCHGWNILSIGFNNNLEVIPFPVEMRDSKRYFYPDDQKDFDHLSKFYLETTVASRHWINPFGTSGTLIENSFHGPLSNLVTTCNGLDWVKYLIKYGYTDNTRVRFVDYNLSFLQFTKDMLLWDGKDYIEYLDQIDVSYFGFLNLPKHIFYGVKDNLNQRWQQFKDETHWEEHWDRIKSDVSFEFVYHDFLHQEPVGDSWIDSTFNSEQSLINLSHVYNYHSTGIFYSLPYRIEAENQTIKLLKETVPDAMIFFDQRSWKGYYRYDYNSLYTRANLLDTVELAQLDLPIWHKI